MVNPAPGFRLTLESGPNASAPRDLTTRFADRLVSLTLTEKRDAAADTLEIVIEDSAGLIDVPEEGVILSLALGWLRGDGVPIGLVEKGKFKVDEAEASGPPDMITIRARSADLTGGYRIRKSRTHEDTTLGAIADKVAREIGLTALVDQEARSIPVTLEAQQGESDMALIRTLGLKHDLAATQKDGKLILSPIGNGKSASGRALPEVTIKRNATDTYRYARAKREQHDGVEARWHDRGSAETKMVKEGHKGTGQPRRLKRIHPTEAAAKAHARSTAQREARKAATCEITLALGRPDFAVEQAVTLNGWKPVIDATKWLIESATHTLDGSGLKTALALETKA